MTKVSSNEIFPDLILVKHSIYDLLNFTFSEFKPEDESQEYNACSFKLNDLSIKFRTAKITPTKVGQFVTLWKRNEKGVTCPHDLSDTIDLYIISVRDKDRFGQFVFPRSILLEHGILSKPGKEGKRGFRVYPPWYETDNKQAQKTQSWQSHFFLEITSGNAPDPELAKKLYAGK